MKEVNPQTRQFFIHQSHISVKKKKKKKDQLRTSRAYYQIFEVCWGSQKTCTSHFSSGQAPTIGKIYRQALLQYHLTYNVPAKLQNFLSVQFNRIAMQPFLPPSICPLKAQRTNKTIKKNNKKFK